MAEDDFDTQDVLIHDDYILRTMLAGRFVTGVLQLSTRRALC
jgi:hypothetical protein